MAGRSVTRGFSVDIWRYAALAPGDDAIFRHDMVHCDLTAVGPALVADGVIVCLERIADLVGGWLKSNWQDRLLLPSSDPEFAIRCLAYTWPRKPFVLAAGDTLAELAEFLLVSVCEPLLRDHGLLACRVVVRRGTEEPITSELGPDIVLAYLEDVARAEPKARSIANAAVAAPAEDPAYRKVKPRMSRSVTGNDSSRYIMPFPSYT